MRDLPGRRRLGSRVGGWADAFRERTVTKAVSRVVSSTGKSTRHTLWLLQVRLLYHSERVANSFTWKRASVTPQPAGGGRSIDLLAPATVGPGNTSRGLAVRGSRGEGTGEAADEAPGSPAATPTAGPWARRSRCRSAVAAQTTLRRCWWDRRGVPPPNGVFAKELNHRDTEAQRREREISAWSCNCLVFSVSLCLCGSLVLVGRSTP